MQKHQLERHDSDHTSQQNDRNEDGVVHDGGNRCQNTNEHENNPEDDEHMAQNAGFFRMEDQEGTLAVAKSKPANAE